MKHKILFLDCDGVLNKACTDGDTQYFNPDCFLWFRDIVARTDAKVVLSSSWRQFNAWYEMLRDFFAVLGIDLIGKTDELDTREEEIGKWILEHRDEIATYVVIDDWDMADAFPGHFVGTCAPRRIGLDKDFADAAVAILNAPQTPQPERKDDHESLQV